MRWARIDRDLILLRFFEGREIEEIAQTVGAAANTVSKRLQRALERLRKIFAERGVTTPAAAIGAMVAGHAAAAPASLQVTCVKQLGAGTGNHFARRRGPQGRIVVGEGRNGFAALCCCRGWGGGRNFPHLGPNRAWNSTGRIGADCFSAQRPIGTGVRLAGKTNPGGDLRDSSQRHPTHRRLDGRNSQTGADRPPCRTGFGCRTGSHQCSAHGGGSGHGAGRQGVAVIGLYASGHQ